MEARTVDVGREHRVEDAPGRGDPEGGRREVEPLALVGHDLDPVVRQESREERAPRFGPVPRERGGDEPSSRDGRDEGDRLGREGPPRCALDVKAREARLDRAGEERVEGVRGRFPDGEVAGVSLRRRRDAGPRSPRFAGLRLRRSGDGRAAGARPADSSSSFFSRKNPSSS